MSKLPTINMLDEECVMQFAKYGNGRPALQIYTVNGEPMCRATTNLPDGDFPSGRPPKPNELFIKNYNENYGIAEKLEKSGLGKITDRTGGPAEVVVLVVTHPEALKEMGIAPPKEAKKKPAPGPK